MFLYETHFDFDSKNNRTWIHPRSSQQRLCTARQINSNFMTLTIWSHGLELHLIHLRVFHVFTSFKDLCQHTPYQHVMKLIFCFFSFQVCEVHRSSLKPKIYTWILRGVAFEASPPTRGPTYNGSTNFLKWAEIKSFQLLKFHHVQQSCRVKLEQLTVI